MAKIQVALHVCRQNLVDRRVQDQAMMIRQPVITASRDDSLVQKKAKPAQREAEAAAAAGFKLIYRNCLDAISPLA